jgi:hypothetical protein
MSLARPAELPLGKVTTRAFYETADEVSRTFDRIDCWLIPRRVLGAVLSLQWKINKSLLILQKNRRISTLDSRLLFPRPQT